MKSVLPLLSFILCIIVSFGQIQLPYDTVTGKVSYTRIIHADSVSKKELFGRAVEWISLNYKSANDVIQLKEEERGKIIVKGLFQEPANFPLFTWKVTMYHTLILDFKDGKCRIQITDLHYRYESSGGGSEGDYESLINHWPDEKNKSESATYWIKFFEKVDGRIHGIFDNYALYMQKPFDNKSDDW